jgi:type VI secretion system secreted protein Hcp
MALPAYMRIVGTKQGEITKDASSPESVGSNHEKTHVDQIKVLAFDHTVEVPRDAISGQTTGLRVHKALRITKQFDKTSPLLMEALTTGEILTEVETFWYRAQPEGGQQLYYRIGLENARIIRIHDYMHNCNDPDKSHESHMEDVYFCYDRIMWSHDVSNTVSVDNYRDFTKK